MLPIWVCSQFGCAPDLGVLGCAPEVTSLLITPFPYPPSRPSPYPLAQLMPDIPISFIREEYEHAPITFGVEQALGWRGTGLAHPGHDCWTFPRRWVPQLSLGFTMVMTNDGG